MSPVKAPRKFRSPPGRCLSLPNAIIAILVVWNTSLLVSKTGSSCLDNQDPRSPHSDAAEADAATAAPQTSRRLRELLEGADPVPMSEWQWGPTLFVALGTKEYAHFLENWVLSIQLLGSPMLVYTLDKESAAVCSRLGAPHRLLPHLENMPLAT